MKKPYYYFLLFFIAWFSQNPAAAQRLNFINYNIGEGLAQSQVTSFCQDQANHLWIGTLGGVSRFDGTEFISFTQQNGLIDNYVNCLFADSLNRIWIGTRSGISIYDGKTFNNFQCGRRPSMNSISRICSDESGRIWISAGFRLYSMGKKGPVKEAIDQDNNAVVADLSQDRQGRLWASVFTKGIFCLVGGQWIKKISLPTVFEKVFINRMVFDRTRSDRIWLMFPNGLLMAEHDSISIKSADAFDQIPRPLTSLAQDASSNLWIGTSRGMHVYSPNDLHHYEASNGFTNNAVHSAFMDRENNLWFGTNGSGMYRYSNDGFRFFDESQGLANPIVMAIEKGQGQELWLGTYGGGMFQYNGKEFIHYTLPSSKNGSQAVILCTDLKGVLWIATNAGELWKYEGKRFMPIKLPDWLHEFPTINQLVPASNGNLWIATSGGCYFYDGKEFRVVLPYQASSCVREIGKDSILIGTRDSLCLYLPEGKIKKIKDSLLLSVTPFCFEKKNNLIIIGTSGRGLLTWDLSTNHFTAYTSRNTTLPDFIYSLKLSGNKNLWIGTGRGISRGIIDTIHNRISVEDFSQDGNLFYFECNQNAIYQGDDSSIWFGTTKGLVTYKQNNLLLKPDPGKILLQTVQLFNRTVNRGRFIDSVVNGYHLPLALELPPDANSLSFQWRAVVFRNARSVRYQYMLEGIDTGFSALSADHSISYSALPSGKYFFLARAWMPGIGYSANTVRFPFEIETPFYKLRWVQLLAVLLLMAIAWLLHSKRISNREKRLRQIEQLKEAEQIKIRKRTSEDFHDELGNKLTRISVLSDVLGMRTDNPESKGIVRQIKDNVAALYNGTRDIVWSLQPENDWLDRVLDRLREFGVELFQETGIEFHFEDLDASARKEWLPSDFSLNLMMIYKEAMNNILKHASARAVRFRACKSEHGQISFSLLDDGNGFDPQNIRKGNGIDHMYVRARRMGAHIEVQSSPGNGTRVALNFHVPFIAGPKKGSL